MVTIRVGRGPFAVAVDTRTRHVFVASGGLTIAGQILGPGSVSMLDATTGALLRTTPLPSTRGFGPLSDPQALAVDERSNRVFVALNRRAAATTAGTEGPGLVSILDATTGALLHTTVVGFLPWAVVVDERANRAFVSYEGYWGYAQDTQGGGVSVLDATTGAVVRTMQLGPREGASVLALDAQRDRVYVGARRVILLDGATGVVRATAHPLPAIRSGTQLLYPHDGACASAVQEQAGEVLALVPVAPGFVMVAVLDGATLVVRHTAEYDTYLGSCPGESMAVDARSGHAWFTSSPLLDSLGVGAIVMISASTGQHLGATPVSAAGTAVLDGMLAVDARRSHVVAVMQGAAMLLPGVTGCLSILDTRSGHLVQNESLRDGPHTVAIDPTTGTLFITNAAADTVTMVVPRALSARGTPPVSLIKRGCWDGKY